MKKNIKIIIFLIIAINILTISIISLNNKGIPDNKLPEDISYIQGELPTIEFKTNFYFLNNKIDYSNKLYLKTGRIYLPLDEIINAMGGKLEVDNNKYLIDINKQELFINKENDYLYPKRIINIDGKDYISMFTLLSNFGYTPVFDCNKNRIDIFYSRNYIDINLDEKQLNPAYLRLEDIMADGLDKDGYYNDIGLEKLRAIADFLYSNKQKFYIAWIPVYKNPISETENNLVKDFNLYNASFLYTLDYLVAKGGKIGIHGYTHQYNNDKSADGYEFGKDTPYSEKECINRLLLAKEIARDLGYKVNFFEFPHYSATKNHLRYAEKYYDVIYQQDNTVKERGHIVDWERKNGRNIKYVPTPADYIISRYDTDGINARIDESINNGLEVSLFYHPKIDFEVIYPKTEDNTRICDIPENTSIYRLLEKIFSEKFTFTYF